MKGIRVAGVIIGCGVFFLGVMPHIGMITDWETIDSTTRLVVSVLSGVVIGLGLFAVLLSSGLLSWLFNNIKRRI